MWRSKSFLNQRCRLHKCTDISLMIGCLLFGMTLGMSLTPNAFAVSVGESAEVVDQEEFRTEHRFGLGLMTGGDAGIFGFDAEFNATESLSAGVTFGTGVDYTTFGLRGRFYLLAKYINPFVGFHYVYWWSDGPISRPGDINPRALVQDLLTPSQVQRLSTSGFDLHMVAPEIGIQFFSTEHYAISGSFMYLANFTELRGTPYGEVTIAWFF